LPLSFKGEKMKETRNIYFVHDDGSAELKCGNDTVLIDGARVDIVSQYQWSIGNHGYVTHGMGKNQILLHRFIVGAKGTEIVDHINHNKFDNRRSNLRVCTNQQNTMNRGKQSNGNNEYKGICFTSHGKWQAQIVYNGESIYLGLYDNAISAAKAYDNAARNLFGKYAYLNLPNSSETEEKEIKHYKKLTETEVNSVRCLYKQGATISELAGIYAHSYSSISRIVRNKTYQGKA
jgi:hypothetical protein